MHSLFQFTLYCRPRLLSLLITTAMLAAPSAAWAHGGGGGDFPIRGDKIRVSKRGFAFRARDPRLAELFEHDLSVEGLSLLVHSMEENPGSTGMIELPAELWKPVHNRAGVMNSYRYKDARGRHGGIFAARVRKHSILIRGRGRNWAFHPQGELGEVQLHLYVENGEYYEEYCASFKDGEATVNRNRPGLFIARNADAPAACPAQTCGNAVVELGETCDDGNLDDEDLCSNSCLEGSCDEVAFASTFEGIQSVIFEGYDCNNQLCHSSANPLGPAGNLVLTAGDAYDNLLGIEPFNAQYTVADSRYRRVVPFEPGLSVLYDKLHAGIDLFDDITPIQGDSMPVGRTMAPEHAQAFWEWIHVGAPSDRVVMGTNALLGVCLPPSDPIKAEIPPRPPNGVQLQQTSYPLPSQSEAEICMATYYDVSGLIPVEDQYNCPARFQFEGHCTLDPDTACTQDSDCGGGDTCQAEKNGVNRESKCFRFHRQVLTQDPQSHHSLINYYAGGADTSDEAWTSKIVGKDDRGIPIRVDEGWTFKFSELDDPEDQAKNGTNCDPTAIDPALGYNPGCSGAVVPNFACNSFGPGGAGFFDNGLVQFSGSQEPLFDTVLDDGVYQDMPVKGIVVWNSHAFNLTSRDSTMSQYLNFELAADGDLLFPVRTIFNASWIFTQYVPPFTTREYCATQTLPQGAKLFELSSHTHRHGVKWRTWAPPNALCRPKCPTAEEAGVHPGLIDLLCPLFESAPVQGVCLNDLTTQCLENSDCGVGGICAEKRFCVNNPEVQCLSELHCPEKGACGDPVLLPLCDDLELPGDERPPIYTSTEYQDPLQLPLPVDRIDFSSPNVEDRTLLFCSLYDNGSGPGSPPLKRVSTSPDPPPLFGGTFQMGGKCTGKQIFCANDPPNLRSCGAVSEIQAERDAFCDSSPGAGDGDCDACPSIGGATTEDEMFILLGNWYLP